MATIDVLKSMVRRKAQEKGLEWLYGVTYRGQPILEYIVQRESGWQPGIPSAYNAQGTEDSWGLFQLNRAGGVGTGHSVQELIDPARNIDIALDNIAGNLASSGNSLAAGFQNWNNPALDPGFNAFIGSEGKGAAQQGEQSFPMSGLWQEGEETMPEEKSAIDKRTEAMWAQIDALFAKGDELSIMAANDLMSNVLRMSELYGVAKTTQEPMSAREEAATQSDWYQNELGKYDRLIAAGQIEPQAAADAFQRQLEMKQEETGRYGYATQRGADVLATLEKRAGRTLPMAAFPGTEQGGLISDVAGMYGLSEPPPLMGAPASSFPDPWQTYQQAMGTAGLGQNLEPVGANMPSVPTYTPPAVPTQGGTNLSYERAQQLLQMALARQVGSQVGSQLGRLF